MAEQEKMNLDNTEEPKETAAPAPKEKKSKAEKKEKAKEKKPGFGKRVGRFFRELKSELKKVSWPSMSETMKKTGIVIAAVLVVGVIVWIFDGLASAVIDALLSIFKH